MRFSFVIFLLCIASILRAQESFSPEELIAVINKFHPVARQANLDVQIAKANITAKRGMFDPVFEAGSARKNFDGVQYYDQRLAELKIPVWYGMDIFLGNEKLNGARLNPEATKGNVTYVGVSVPLIQNLVTDKRRAALQLAKIYREKSIAEQSMILNELHQDALLAYWQWWEAYETVQLVNAALQNANNRLKMVKLGFVGGDRPAIDTIEALAQVQTFEQMQNESVTELIKTRHQLSLYLWTETGEYTSLPENVVPRISQLENTTPLENFLDAVVSHPSLLAYNFELNGINIEKKLAFQLLLPELNLKYNQLGRDLSKSLNGPWFENNYRFGVTLSVPLRLSAGRGGYQAASFKLRKAALGRQYKEKELQTKVKQYYAAWHQAISQFTLQQSLVANYITLQKGEELKFQSGESSLFLINARELKTIEARQKQISVRAKLEKAKVQLYAAAGLLGR